MTVAPSTAVNPATFVFGSDDTAAIQAAIDAVQLATNAAGNFPSVCAGGTVFLPFGRYVITGHLTLYEGTVLRGTGMFASAIYNANAAGDDAIQVDVTGRQPALSPEYFAGACDLDIQGQRCSGHGISFVDFACYTKWRRLLIRNHGADGIHMDEIVHASFRDCYSHGNFGWGLFVTGTGPAACSTTLNFDSCEFRSNGQRTDGVTGGVNINAGVACSFTGRNLIEANCWGPGMVMNGTRCNCYNLYFEENDTDSGNLEALRVTNYSNLFVGTYFNANQRVRFTAGGTTNLMIGTQWANLAGNVTLDAGATNNQFIADDPLYARQIAGDVAAILSTFGLDRYGIGPMSGPINMSASDLQFGGGNIYGVPAGSVILSGGESAVLGGRVVAYGNAHATKADTIELYGSAALLAAVAASGWNIPAGTAYQVNGVNVADGAAWATYVPVVTASGAMTIANLVVNRAAYKALGKVVTLDVKLTFDLAAPAGQFVYITVPAGCTPAHAVVVMAVQDLRLATYSSKWVETDAVNGLQVGPGNNGNWAVPVNGTTLEFCITYERT